MEFISNYGWVILIIMILAIIIAFYIGRADLFGSDQCILKAGLGCKEFQFTKKVITLNIINSLGKNLAPGSKATLECNELNKFSQNSFTDHHNLPVKNGHNFSFSFAPLKDIYTRASCRVKIVYTEDRFGAYEKSAEGTLRWKNINTQGTPPPESCDWYGDDDFDGCLDDRDSNCGNKEIDIGGPNSCFDQEDNDCSYARDCADNSPGDCCENDPRCFDNTISGEALGEPNAYNEFWCICNDNRWTPGQHESDTDCGLNCTTYYNKRCSQGQACVTNTDCLTNLVCYGGICQLPNCQNDIFDLDESDIISGIGAYNPGGWSKDCGGTASGCNRCEQMRHCNADTDCGTNLICCSCSDPMNNYCGQGGSPIIFKPQPQCDSSC